MVSQLVVALPCGTLLAYEPHIEGILEEVLRNAANKQSIRLLLPQRMHPRPQSRLDAATPTVSTLFPGIIRLLPRVLGGGCLQSKETGDSTGRIRRQVFAMSQTADAESAPYDETLPCSAEGVLLQMKSEPVPLVRPEGDLSETDSARANVSCKKATSDGGDDTLDGPPHMPKPPLHANFNVAKTIHRLGQAGHASEIDAAWKEQGGTELDDVLSSGAVVLLDAEWMVDLARRGGVLQPRQMLPDEAFVHVSRMKQDTWHSGLPIVSVSHCWLQPDHPDPLGHNLRTIAAALDKLLDFYRRKRTVAVFYDFCSLHQRCRGPDGAPQPRTFEAAEGGRREPGAPVGRYASETTLFHAGLGSLGSLYSHPSTMVFMLTAFPPDYHTDAYTRSGNVKPYLDRGWCWCESSWAALVKSYDDVVDLGKLKIDGDWGSIISSGIHGRRAPMLPERFAESLQEKTFTNGKTDAPLVTRLYREAFEQRMGAQGSLDFHMLGWGDAEATAVAEVIRHRYTPNLVDLRMCYNQIGDAGAIALAKALPQVPELVTLKVWLNVIGDSGAAAIAEAVTHLPKLETIELDRNHIGDLGAAAIAEALRRVPKLKRLVLSCNQIGDDGGRAFAKVRPDTSLERLFLHMEDNPIGSETMQAIKAAWGYRQSFGTLNHPCQKDVAGPVDPPEWSHSDILNYSEESRSNVDTLSEISRSRSDNDTSDCSSSHMREWG